MSKEDRGQEEECEWQEGLKTEAEGLARGFSGHPGLGPADEDPESGHEQERNDRQDGELKGREPGGMVENGITAGLEEDRKVGCEPQRQEGKQGQGESLCFARHVPEL
jgi:hypothetical protein